MTCVAIFLVRRLVSVLNENRIYLDLKKHRKHLKDTFTPLEFTPTRFSVICYSFKGKNIKRGMWVVQRCKRIPTVDNHITCTFYLGDKDDIFWCNVGSKISGHAMLESRRIHTFGNSLPMNTILNEVIKISYMLNWLFLDAI